MNVPSILVFDSGIGGLSVVHAIQDRIAHCTLHYLTDNENFPYGSLSEAELLARVTFLIETRIKSHPVDIIVVACNTASTLVLETLRKNIGIPIVGVVPAIKPAAQLTKTGHIGLLATPATIKRDYTNKLIEEFAPTVNVHRIGSQALVELAENLELFSQQRKAVIETELAEWVSTPLITKLDVIVLACTHFPLLRAEIQNVVGPTVILLDSGEAIARRVEQLLVDIQPTSEKHDNVAIFTDNKSIRKQTQALLSSLSFTRIEAFSHE